MTEVNGGIVKLSAKDIHVIMQALRIAAEDGSLDEYASKAHVNQIRERLSNAK